MLVENRDITPSVLFADRLEVRAECNTVQGSVLAIFVAGLLLPSGVVLGMTGWERAYERDDTSCTRCSLFVFYPGIMVNPSSLVQQTSDSLLFVFIRMGMVKMAAIITMMIPTIPYSFQFSRSILLFIRRASRWNSYASPPHLRCTVAVLAKSSVLSMTRSSFSPRCSILSR